MGSKWRKGKFALRLNMFLYVPKTLEDSPALPAADGRFSDAVSLSLTIPARNSCFHVDMPPLPPSLVLPKADARENGNRQFLKRLRR